MSTDFLSLVLENHNLKQEGGFKLFGRGVVDKPNNIEDALALLTKIGRAYL